MTWYQVIDFLAELRTLKSECESTLKSGYWAKSCDYGITMIFLFGHKLRWMCSWRWLKNLNKEKPMF